MIEKVSFLGLKMLIAQMICHPLVGHIIGVVFGNRIPAHGLTIETQSSTVLPKTKAELFWGIYEGAEIGFIRRYLTPGDDVLELGSSLGVTSCMIGKMIGAGGRLVSVEANPELMSISRRNLEINLPDVNVFFVNRAIDYSGKNPVWLNFGNDSTSSMTQMSTGTDSRRGAWVTASTLAGLIGEYQLNDFILVCDIEGAEYGFLSKDGDALNQCRMVIIELHTVKENHHQICPAQMVDIFINKHGFTVRDQRGPVFVFERKS